MDLNALREKPARYIIGLTVGASCVGIDGALVRIKGSGLGTGLKLVHAAHFPYVPATRHRLYAVRKDPRILGTLNFELGELLADAALQIKKAAGEEAQEVDLVAVQGYVLAHAPRRGGAPTYGALQLGESSVVAHRTGLPVVSDFSIRDIAAGGQGKPFAPYADWLLFTREDRTVATLHLGAFAAFTVIAPKVENVVAFETGPCNIAIDGAIQQITTGNREFDKGGAEAAQGVVIDEFLNFLLEPAYFNRVPPKSTSRDEFGPDVYLRDAVAGRRDRSLGDLMATVTAAAAFSIIRAYTRFIKPSHELARIILSGGGALNTTLVEHIRKAIPEAIVRQSDEYKLPCTALDPIRAAVIGNETVCGNPANIPHATGADRPVFLGKLTPP